MKYITVTKENFEKEVIASEKPVLLDFWASWCGPCRMIAPTIEKLAEENDDIKVGKVNVDEERELAASFGIEVIPTLIALKEGKVINKASGVLPEEALLALFA